MTMLVAQAIRHPSVQALEDAGLQKGEEQGVSPLLK
jgi:hypothetical protein